MKDWEQYSVAYFLLWMMATIYIDSGTARNMEQILYALTAMGLGVWCAYRAVRPALIRLVARLFGREAE
jgi:hypothetical protein